MSSKIVDFKNILQIVYIIIYDRLSEDQIGQLLLPLSAANIAATMTDVLCNIYHPLGSHKRASYGLVGSARHPDVCLIYRINLKICVCRSGTADKGTPTDGAVAPRRVPDEAASNRPVARKFI